MNLYDPLPEEGERRFGEELGATLWGGTVYDVAPGARVCAYHWHFGEEEWLLVVAGAPTLRTPEGERVLRPWDGAVFVTGEAGAHEVRNDTDEPVRVVLLSTASDPEVCVYPDSGKVGVFAGWSRKDVHFPEGEAGAHQFRNDGAAPLRVLIGSTKSGLCVAGYPDSGKLLIDAPDARRMIHDSPEVEYWDGE